MSTDKGKDTPRNPNTERGAELVIVASHFLESLGVVPNEVAQSLDQTKPLASALNQIDALFCEFSDPKQITSCQIRLRQTREEDAVLIREGDDPGIHLQLRRNSGEMAELNIYGGLRAVTSSDFQDQGSSAVRNQSHTQRTINLSSDPTVVGVDIYDSEGHRVTNIWFQLTPEANAPIAQGITLTKLNYLDGQTKLELKQPLIYPQGEAQYLLDILRRDVRKLQKIRGAAWL
jgi:hypothetical protein